VSGQSEEARTGMLSESESTLDKRVEMGGSDACRILILPRCIPLTGSVQRRALYQVQDAHGNKLRKSRSGSFPVGQVAQSHRSRSVARPCPARKLNADPCNFFLPTTSKFAAAVDSSTHNLAMAPSTKTARTLNAHERVAPGITKDAPKFRPEYDLEPNDTEEAALQVVSTGTEQDWEGFEERDADEGEDVDEEEDASSDDESVEIVVEKKEKPVLPKDAEEEELERLIFGDSAGFKHGIESFSLKQSGGTFDDEQSGASDEDGDYANAADQDLFFFDAGPTAAPAGSLAVANADESEDDGENPAWEDSDDERLVVSLASVPQLRKLRETVDDDMVNGKEYARRLRNQYERLYPTPEWAIHATGKAKRKRRHTMEDDESDEGSASDMDIDEEDLSTLPIAKLLKDADILSRTSRGPTKRRKLQAGTVDIQRLKDVSKQGPVRIPFYALPIIR